MTGEAGRSRRIDALRGIAAVSVLVGHVWLVSKGYARNFEDFTNRFMLTGGQGVYLFFALSGYLLSLPFLRAAYSSRGGTVDVRRYARNRVLRIVPLFYVTVLVLIVVQPFGAERSDVWRFLLFVHPFSSETANTLDPPMWSLASEVQFYALLPLLMAGLAFVTRGSWRAAAGVLTALGIASYVVRSNAREWRLDGEFWSSALLGSAGIGSLLCYFCVGIAVALLLVRVEERGMPRLPSLLQRADTYIVLGAAAWLGTSLRTGNQNLMLLSAPLILAGAVLPLRSGPLVRLLEFRGLVGLGVVSYSLYLLHVPILFFLTDSTKVGSAPAIAGRSIDFLPLLAIGFPLAVAVATLSYFAIERPFLRMRGRWAPAGAVAPAEAPSPPAPAPAPAAA